MQHSPTVAAPSSNSVSANASATEYLRAVLPNLPTDWLGLTTHRLDIYDEAQAKSQFLAHFEDLYRAGQSDQAQLAQLPTAYDYIRLGHPLSCVLEWAIAKQADLAPSSVISFSSQTMPILAVLRKNLLTGTPTLLVHTGELPAAFDINVLRRVYGYSIEVQKVKSASEVPTFAGTIVFVGADSDDLKQVTAAKRIDFAVALHGELGSVLMGLSAIAQGYISDIQHVRRRETVAMTPADALAALKALVGESAPAQLSSKATLAQHTASVAQAIQDISATDGQVLLGSSGLSVQYAIMMGLIDDALTRHPGKAIKFVVPPNCYGGTNDQARRVAACRSDVEVVDLPVDGDNDMVRSLDTVLATLAAADAIPYVIAEIPTNPRVEVPDLPSLQAALAKPRKTAGGQAAIAPVFILDQTFCPNVQFLGKGDTLAEVRAIAYVSGSKFPSGGKCTAGFCIGNAHVAGLMDLVAEHLALCDNGATAHQVALLAEQLPSMLQRIQSAYDNTRAFVTHIEKVLPAAKINFVSKALAAQGFTPSVFSLDLPKKGDTEAEREAYKRKLNRKLIDTMITEIPEESKFCVSYGQLAGCYWTVPATTTQGTTKEGDKDYIVRVSLSPKMDVGKHKEVFSEFVAEL